MDMKKCAAIPLNIYIQNLRKYNTVLYTNLFIEKKKTKKKKKKKKQKHERPKDVW